MNKSRKFNTFIVGAPKCGTTAIAKFLSDHPSAYVPPIKEPHFFCTDFPEYRRVSVESEYSKLSWAAPESATIVCDASVWNLYSTKAAKLIRSYNPDAKIVISIRNPVNMLPSLHGQLCFSGRESIRSFEEAFLASDRRRQGLELPSKVLEPSHLFYDSVCNYYEQIQRYREHFSDNQIRVVVFENFFSDISYNVQSLFAFLGIDQNFKVNTSVVNSARRHKFSRLSSFLMHPPGILLSIKSKARVLLPMRYASPMRYIYNILSEPNKQKPVSASLRNKINLTYEEDTRKLRETLKIPTEKWEL